MKKIIIIILLMALVLGCGTLGRRKPVISTVGNAINHTLIILRGVVYASPY